MSFVLFSLQAVLAAQPNQKKRDTFYPVQNQPQEDPAVLREHQQAGSLPEMRHKSFICPASPQTSECILYKNAGQARLWQKTDRT